jgi:flagellar biosynthesis component FlhA
MVMVMVMVMVIGVGVGGKRNQVSVDNKNNKKKRRKEKKTKTKTSKNDNTKKEAKVRQKETCENRLNYDFCVILNNRMTITLRYNHIMNVSILFFRLYMCYFQPNKIQQRRCVRFCFGFCFFLYRLT